MHFTKTGLLLCSLALLPVMVNADDDVPGSQTGLPLTGLQGGAFPGAAQGLSLLDPQRLQMSQSYGLMYSYSSGQRKGDLVGLYQNMLSYRFSPRLNMKVGLGYLHQPVAALSQNDTIRNQALMTAFQVDYQPFHNVFIHFGYQSLPVIDSRDRLWRYGYAGGGWDW
jgi:hypothetical protein